MGRSPCCPKEGVLKKGAWTPEEDQKLIDYIKEHGHGNWRALPKKCGLQRCGKSCRLRWTNYLRPDIKRGAFSAAEEQKIIQLHALVGNKWAFIASQLPKRTDNEIKNYWNTVLKKRTQPKNNNTAMMNMSPQAALAKPEINGDFGDHQLLQLLQQQQQKMMMMMMTTTKKSVHGSRTVNADEANSNIMWAYDRSRSQRALPNNGGGGGSTIQRSNSTTSCCNHLAQWESARLEAEARLAERSKSSPKSSPGGAAIDWLLRGGGKSTCNSSGARPTAPKYASPLPIELPDISVDHGSNAAVSSLDGIPNLFSCSTASVLLGNNNQENAVDNVVVPAAPAADYRHIFHANLASGIRSTISAPHPNYNGVDRESSAAADTTDNDAAAAAGLITFQISNRSRSIRNAQTSKSSCCSHDQILSTGFSAAATSDVHVTRHDEDQDLFMSSKKRTEAAASAIKLGANGRLTWNRHELTLPNLITNPPPFVLNFLQHSATPATGEDSAGAAAAFNVNAGIMNRVPSTKPEAEAEVGESAAAAATSAASLLSLAAVESILSSFSGIDEEVDAAGKAAVPAMEDGSNVGIGSGSHEDENSMSGSSFNMSSMLQDFYSSLQQQQQQLLESTAAAKGLAAAGGGGGGGIIIRSSSNNNANCNMISNSSGQSIDDICNLLQHHVASTNSKSSCCSSSSPANAEDAAMPDVPTTTHHHNFFLLELANQQMGGSTAPTFNNNNNYVTQTLNFQQLESLFGEASEAQFNNLLMDLNLC